MATEVGSAYVTIYPNTDSFSSSISKALGNFASGGILSTAKVALGTALGSLASDAIRAVSSNVGEGIARYDTMQNFPKLMQAFGYTSEEAAQSIKDVQDHLDGLPGSTDEVLRLIQSISDSTGSLGLATSTGLAFNDMLTAAGADATTAAMATRMFDQMLGGAEFSSQRWYALVSKMPLQMKLVAEAMLGAGATTEDLGAALESGTVSVQDMAVAMTELAPTFENQARAMSDGIGTAMANFKHRIAAGIASILDVFGQSNIAGVINGIGYGFRDALREVAGALEFIVTRFDELGVGEKLAEVGRRILEFFGIDESSAAAFRETIYGVENVIAEWIDNALQWLIDNGDKLGELIRPFTDSMADFIDRAGNWLIASGEALGGAIDGIFQILTSSDPNPIKDLASAIFEIKDALREAIFDAFDWFAEHPDLLESIIIGVGAALTYTALVTLLPQLAAGIVAVAKALILFFSSNIVALVIGAAAALIYFFTQTDEGKAIVKAFVDGVKQWWEIFSKRTKEIFEGISKFFTDTWENIKKWVTEKVEALVNGVMKWWDNVKKSTSDTWEAIKKAISDVVDAVKTTVTNVWEGLKTTVSNIWNGIKQAISDVVNAVKTTVTDVWTGLKDTVSNIWNGIKTAVTGAIDGARQFVSDKVNAIKTTVGNVFEGLKTTVSNIWNRIKDGMTGPIESAKNTIRNIIDAIKGFFNFNWKLPEIKLPHLVITGWSDFPLIGSIPTGWAVNWYARGGIVDGAQLIGVGESGREGILPLENKRYMRPFAQAVAANMPQGGSGVEVTGNTFVVREEADINRIAEQLNEMITMQRMGALA